ncbi:queuosine precursor transporter [Longimicrobium sp.]|uniref:queuosine precursor transporter n=1 Tax=Longimicrobium sp. TaxID=2029185 RepID=UPI002E34E195|nr:queuosine precursor transporter [Longimicrobium sp.]HEX6038359.1 queuosine precursor transporter [Longimicrobium sp.]
MAQADAVAPLKQYRYYDFITATFVTVLLCSNLIGPAKVCEIGGFTFGAGILFFPISYLFGDILTEVYGYARARRVVWTGFGALAFASLMSVVVLRLPPAPSYTGQAALESVFGITPRIVAASLLAFWAGEFANSFALAKMKVRTQGRRLWERAIGSTAVGAAVDSGIFYPVALLGVLPTRVVLSVMVTNYVLKVLWEVLMLPVTYRVVNALKRAENEDYFDRRTDFTPFSLRAD